MLYRNVATTTVASAFGNNYLFYIAEPGAMINYWKFKDPNKKVDSVVLQVNGENVRAGKGYARAITVANGGIRLYLFGKENKPDKLVEYCLDSEGGSWYEGSLSTDNNFNGAPDSILSPIVEPLSIIYQSKGAGQGGLSVATYTGGKKWNSVDSEIVLPKT